MYLVDYVIPNVGTPLVLMVMLTHWLILVIPNIVLFHLLAEFLVAVPQSVTDMLPATNVASQAVYLCLG